MHASECLFYCALSCQYCLLNSYQLSLLKSDINSKPGYILVIAADHG